ncbi:spore germination protein GerPC [Neobacillus fumarioli]|uniref:spore germination protein GerPC n=1 Tax=Neobacillus fumarioli TaxID=105229 RepID=UPI00082A23ED|nr:spore germination protein GerPC [Neobacillus fumarioli]
MYQDIYQYLQWMQNLIQAQENKIASLEQAIFKMREEMKRISEQKTIHVDKIEYNFDQLKVETLEGTLSIGLNPNDLSGIEDFSVQNQSFTGPVSPKMQMQRSMKIEEAIYQYLETDLPRIIEETQERLAMQPNGSYLNFIKEDIMKQLPNRIDEHLKTIAKDHTIDSSAADDQIIELLKQEIQNGVMAFLSNLPENVKGMKPDEL